MRTLKGWITTTCLAGMVLVSAMTANGGVIIGGLVNQPCTDTKTKIEKVDSGVIIGGLTSTGVIIGGLSAVTGVIIGGLTGVIIGGLSSTDDSVVNCGVIIGG